MQDGFFQKVVLSMVVALGLTVLVEFYKNFVNGADDALNGRHHPVHMTPHK